MNFHGKKKTFGFNFNSKVSPEETQPVSNRRRGYLDYLSSLVPNNPFSETLRKAADIFDEVR